MMLRSSSNTAIIFLLLSSCCSVASGFLPAVASRRAEVHASNQKSCLAARTKTESGLQYEDIVVGDGKRPGANDYVSVHYDAKFARNGKVFDSSRPEEVGLEEKRQKVFQGKPIQFPLGKGKVIAGMDEGVSTMNVGGKRRLFIPSALGYGEAGYQDVAPNTDLQFDVELVSIDFPMSGQFGTAGSLFDGLKVALGLIALNGLTEAVTGTELREYIYNAIN